MMPGPWLEIGLTIVAAGAVWAVFHWIRTGAADQRDLEQEKQAQEDRRDFRARLAKTRSRLRRLFDDLGVPKHPNGD